LDQFPRDAFLQETGSGQRDSSNQLCPLILQAASKDPVFGIEQFPCNSNERILRGGRTRTIGPLVPSVSGSFFASRAEAAQAVARLNDSLVIVTPTQNDPHTEIENVNILMRHRADGLIIAPANSRSAALRDMLMRFRVTGISIDRPLLGVQISSAVADNFTGACLGTKHLIEHGCRQIVCLIGESTLYTIRRRIRGYRKRVEVAGINMLHRHSIRDYKSA
jgi:LacI family transcriptional regulator